MSEKFVSRKQRNRQNTLILSIFVLIALGLGAWFYVQNKEAGELPKNSLARITKSKGGFRINRSNKKILADTGFLLLAGDRIQTRPEASLTITYLDQSTVLDLQGGTIIILEDPEKGKKFRLQSGQVQLNVQDMPKGMDTTIESNNMVATVCRVGRFTCSSQGMQTTCSVHKGRLHIRRIRDGQEKVLSSGEDYCCRPQEGAARIEFQEMDL